MMNLMIVITVTLLISIFISVMFTKIWANSSSYGILGKVWLVTLFVMPYLGVFLLDYILGYDTSKQYRNVDFALIGFVFGRVLFYVPMFGVWVMVMGGRSESFRVNSLNIPTFIGRTTEYTITHQSAIASDPTRFDGVMTFHFFMTIAIVILSILYLIAWPLAVIVGIFSFIYLKNLSRSWMLSFEERYPMKARVSPEPIEHDQKT
jgi:hypothetical protein